MKALTLILELLLEFSPASFLRFHAGQLEMVTTQYLETCQRFHKGELSLKPQQKPPKNVKVIN